MTSIVSCKTFINEVSAFANGEMNLERPYVGGKLRGKTQTLRWLVEETQCAETILSVMRVRVRHLFLYPVLHTPSQDIFSSADCLSPQLCSTFWPT